MSIYTTYAEIIMNNIIKDLLKEGTVPTSNVIVSEFDAFTTSNDLTKPLFIAKDYVVVSNDSSSASLYNNANQDVKQDLQVLYSHLLKLGNTSMTAFDRWKQETNQLEIELMQLEDRISNLLLLANDTAGYFNFIYDDFKDATKIDQSESTIKIDLSKGILSIGSSNTTATRIDLTDLTDKDIEFNVLSKNNLLSTISASGSKLIYAISDKSNFWQERIYTSSSKPTSAELKIKLGSNQTISRLDLDLHSSNSGAAVQITPFYSIDGYNFFQLPTSNFTQHIKDKGSFTFSPVVASVIKIIMTKTAYDKIDNGKYVYEFGFDEISLFNESFATSTDQEVGSVFISEPLYVLNANKEVEEFSRLAIEVCETVPTGTSINYMIAVSNLSTVPASGITYTDIDPSNRSVITKPVVVDFGDLSTITISGIQVSYDNTEFTTEFINPDKDYSIITDTSGTVANISTAIASAKRYNFLNKEDRILSHCIASGVDIATGTLEVWRNVSVKGSEVKVRDTVRGWGFKEPYYSSTVYVSNSNGVDIDFGSQPILIDGVAKVGVVNVKTGNHKVQVHKANWKKIDTSGITDLATLKSADSLYPYNHRYLIEGFSYPTTYPTTDLKVYTGFDIVAEYLMKENSLFDLLNNIVATNYEYFAFDKDVPDTAVVIDGSTTSKPAQRIFLLKVDPSYADFINELFIIKFKAVDTLYKYIRLKAILKTTDATVAPSIDSYRVKISM